MSRNSNNMNITAYLSDNEIFRLEYVETNYSNPHHVKLITDTRQPIQKNDYDGYIAAIGEHRRVPVECFYEILRCDSDKIQEKFIIICGSDLASKLKLLADTRAVKVATYIVNKSIEISPDTLVTQQLVKTYNPTQLGFFAEVFKKLSLASQQNIIKRHPVETWRIASDYVKNAPADTLRAIRPHFTKSIRENEHELADIIFRQRPYLTVYECETLFEKSNREQTLSYFRNTIVATEYAVGIMGSVCEYAFNRCDRDRDVHDMVRHFLRRVKISNGFLDEAIKSFDSNTLKMLITSLYAERSVCEKKTIEILRLCAREDKVKVFKVVLDVAKLSNHALVDLCNEAICLGTTEGNILAGCILASGLISVRVGLQPNSQPEDAVEVRAVQAEPTLKDLQRILQQYEEAGRSISKK